MVKKTKTQQDWKNYRPKKLSPEEVRDGCLYLHKGDPDEARICVVNEELRQGLDFVKTYPKSVTVFGSARLAEDDEHYLQAQEFGRMVAELGYAVVTGGGPGIMEAAHRGARERDGRTIGFTIQLPMEQTTNKYVTDELAFHYFFTRKVALSYSAEVYAYFPGGYGTLDELFEILTLVQTEKIPKVPIILIGSDFWQPLDEFIKATLLEDHDTISKEDIHLYTITDNLEDAIEIVKNAPLREE